MRVKLILEYDGTDFAGWQAQPKQRTVQGVLEEALHRLTGETVRVEGAGRTDAGAHACGQVASFSTTASIPAMRFAAALNAVLPADVKAISSEEVPLDFHARFSASGKIYRYVLLLQDAPSPLARHRVWQIGTRLDVPAMERALPLFLGTNDFKAFCAAHSNVTSTIRTLREASLVREGDTIDINFEGNGFLYRMVRNMVGALVAVGQYRASAADISEALTRGRRPLAFATAPAQGLYLVAIKYT